MHEVWARTTSSRSQTKIFMPTGKNRSGQLPIPFSFKCARMLIAFYITCQQSTSEMDVDQATLAAASRLGDIVLIEKSTSRLSQSWLFARVLLNSESS